MGRALFLVRDVLVGAQILTSAQVLYTDTGISLELQDSWGTAVVFESDPDPVSVAAEPRKVLALTAQAEFPESSAEGALRRRESPEVLSAPSPMDLALVRSPRKTKRKASHEDGLEMRFKHAAMPARVLALPRECKTLEAAPFLGALRHVPAGTAAYKKVQAAHAPLWTSAGPIRHGATLEEVARLQLVVHTGDIIDMPNGHTLTWSARGLAGQRVTIQAADTWTWAQLHLQVCAAFAQCEWDQAAPLAMFTHTRATGLDPLPQPGDLLGELAAQHSAPFNLRLEVFPHRLGRGRGESEQDRSTPWKKGPSPVTSSHCPPYRPPRTSGCFR